MAVVVGISDIITFFTLKFPNEIKTYIQSLLNPLSEVCTGSSTHFHTISEGGQLPAAMKHNAQRHVIYQHTPALLAQFLEASLRMRHYQQVWTCFSSGK